MQMRIFRSGTQEWCAEDEILKIALRILVLVSPVRTMEPAFRTTVTQEVTNAFVHPCLQVCSRHNLL